MKERIKKFIMILPIVWMGVIFLFSHQPGNESAELSGNIASMLIISMDALGFEVKEAVVHQSIRSLAHFSIFFILGALWYVALLCRGMRVKRTIVWVIAIGVTYALTDEIHQLFVPGRYCDIKDILVDTAGVLLAVGIGWWIAWRKGLDY